MRQNLHTILLLALTTVVAAQNYSPEVEARIKAVENHLLIGPWEVAGEPGANIEDRMRDYGVKGLSIAVINDYKIEWAKGYGWADSAENRRVTPETIFEPGSISKSLNAVGVMKLVENGTLDLHTDINTYLKSWKFPYSKIAKGKKITLAQLLSHTAGLSQHGFPGYYYTDTLPTIYQILDGKKPANTQPVRSELEPGKKYKYSGGGTMVSQLVVMDVTQKNYADYMDETIFKPLGMKNSFFTQPPPKERLAQMATGYLANGKEVPGKHAILLEQGAGGLWTTPSDLARFIIAVQRSYDGQSSFLKKETVRKMFTAVADAGLDSIGLGVFLPKTPHVKYFSHGAGNQGFRGHYIGSCEGGKGFVVFINGERGDIMYEVLGAVATAYNWTDYAKSAPRKAIKIPDSIIAKYEGTYRADEVITSIVKTEEGYHYLTGVKKWKMYFTSDTTFFNRESMSDKVMVRDGRGGYKLERWMNGKKLNTADKVTIITLSNELAKRYAGEYMLDEPVKIVTEGNNLLFTFESNKWPLHFLNDTQFYLDEILNTVFTFRFKGKNVTGFSGKGEKPSEGKRIK